MPLTQFGTTAARTDLPVSVAWYGDLSTAPGAALQAAINAYPNGGVHLVMPPGSYTWESVPLLASGYTAPLKITLAGCKITLTSGAPRLFDLRRIGNGYSNATFQNIHIEGPLLLDRNSINSGDVRHVIFGTRGGANAVNLHPGYQFDNIKIRKIKAINLPAPDSTGTTWTGGVYIGVGNSSGDALSTVTNIWVEDVEVYGGDAGVNVVALLGTGQSATGSNYYFDNIHYHRCRHDTGVVFDGTTNYGGAANFFAVGRGYGGYVHMSDCRGSGSGDVGLEIDCADYALIENVQLENGGGFYHTNQHAPSSSAAQTIEFRNCSYRRSSGLQKGAGLGVTADATFGAGNIRVKNYRYHRSTPDLVAISQSSESMQFYGSTNIDLDGVDIVLDGLSYAVSSLVTQYGIDVQGMGNQTVRVTGRRLRWRLAGAQTGGTSQMAYFGIHFRQSSNDTILWDLSDLTADVTITSPSGNTWRGVYADNGTQAGTVKGYRFVRMTDLSARICTIGNTGTLTINAPNKIRFENVSVPVPGGVAQIVMFGTNGTDSNSPNVEFVALRPAGTSQIIAPASIAPGASPYAYRNYDMWAQTVIVQGGTVSKIEISRDGTTYYDTGVTAGPIRVDPGHYLKVTYSVAPTMTKYPIYQ